MRPFILVSLVLGIAGCATSKPAGPVPTSFQPVCMPCPMPCTPENSCAQPKVAEAPKPPPPPPAPAPAPEPAATPTFSPAPGSFTSPQQVQISSATPGAAIHCTTDGSNPTESSPICSGPIAVDKNTTIRAIATKAGVPASTVATGRYAIQPPETPRVVVTKQKFELKDKIYFDTGKATIKPESYGLLDEVAQALKNHEEVKKLSIDGHTDSTGNAKANQKLSVARANAIRDYLTKKGVEPSRLETRGFGQTKPIASNKTKQGREQNRRVEFNIVGG